MVGKQIPSSSTSARCLRNNNKGNKNVPVKKGQHKTYGKVNNKNNENSSKENTLENNLWMDSFDRLLVESHLQNKKTDKNLVRISYNKDSSIDLSEQGSTSNINSCKNEERKLKNNTKKKYEESSPFNLEKSLAAINHKMKKKLQKPKPKCNIQKNQNKKLKNNQRDILKIKTVASTPVIKRNFDNLLSSCIISPIKCKKKQLFNSSTVPEKLILNYTDSIEEARNMSQLNLNNYDKSKNYSFFMKSSQNYNEFIQNDEFDLVKYNQAGLETDELKNPNSMNNFQNPPLSTPLNYNETLQNQLEKKNNLIQLPDKEQNLLHQNNSCHIISINSTKSHPEPINIDDVQIIAQYNEMPENIKSIQLIEDSHNLTSDNNNINKLNNSIYSDSINNRSKSSNYELNNIKSNDVIDSLQIIETNKEINENNTDIITRRNSNRKSIDIFPDTLCNSLISNKLDSPQSVLKNEHNSVFANKLKFLQNCQILNDNIRFSKSLNSLDHNERINEIIRRHSFESYKTKKRKNYTDNIKIKDVLNLKLKHQIYCGQSYNSSISIRNGNNGLISNEHIQENQKSISDIVMQNNTTNDISDITDSNFKYDNPTNFENMTDTDDKIELNSCVRESIEETTESYKKILDKNMENISETNITKRRHRHTDRSENINVDEKENHGNQLINNKKISSKIPVINIDESCEFIPGTPRVLLRRIKKSPIELVKNVTKDDTLKRNEINIIRLPRTNFIDNRTTKSLLGNKQPDKNCETYEKLITSEDHDVQLEKTPIVQLKSASRCRNTRGVSLKIVENHPEESRRNLSKENSNVNYTRQHKKRLAKSLATEKKIPNKKQEVTVEKLNSKVHLRNCKVILNKILPKMIKDTNKIEQIFKIKKCKIRLKRINLNSLEKLIQNNLNSPKCNEIKLTKNTLPNIDTVDLNKNNEPNKSNAKKTVSFKYVTQRKSRIVSSLATVKKSNSSSCKTNSGVKNCFVANNEINRSQKCCSVIDVALSFNDDEFINEDKECENIIRVNSKLTLPSGKWRRTLINWKHNQSVIELDESQISVVLDKNTTISLGKTIAENKNKLMPKISSTYKQNTIISDQLIDKELKTQILPAQRIINNERKACLNSSLVYIPEKTEAECKIIEKRQTGVRKTLLLEPTDDGTPNYTTCSLFNTFAKPKAAETVFVSNRQNTKKSKRFIEIEEEDFDDLQDDKQQQQQQIQLHHREEYSDETRCNNTFTNNKIQKFQQQLSVPICGTKLQQSSIQRSTRRGRTSIIETTNNIGFEQLSSSSPFTGSGDYHHHQSDREFIHSLLLNDDEQNILHFPSLNVSIRALLSPRDIVLRRCGQTDPYDFSIIYSEIELRQCRKIGEGVYGEVYMNKNRNGEAVVLKIIPIDGQIEINGEQQKNFEQILPEIIIAAELSHLRNDSNFMTSGFVEVKNVHCVQGRYPQHLIDLWELYRDNCGTENDHPEIFQDDQLYIVLELANGGQDLEAFQFQNALQSYSAFLQTALSLAVAERKFKFEHRDLHWGNILLAATDDKEIKFKFNDKIISIPTHGVKATIIDYTLSRMNFEGCCLYNDLSNDNELFSASGDYQFDIYRLMKKNLKNQWERYDPFTNILWLHYTIDKMISGARYRASKTKKHRSAIQDMMDLRDELLDYKSASDYVECLD